MLLYFYDTYDVFYLCVTLYFFLITSLRRDCILILLKPQYGMNIYAIFILTFHLQYSFRFPLFCISLC